MKKFGQVILTAVIAASMIAGCGNQLSDTDPSAITALTSSEASESTDASASTSVDTPKTFEELYGNQIMTYMNHQYYYGGEKILLQESNFYFINAFVDLSNYANMGYYPATPLGFIDLAADYELGDEYKTYGDYFIYYAENSIESTCILCERANAEGITLDADTQKQIDDMIVSLKTEKAPESGLSFEEYLQLWYGPGMDEASFRTVVERYFLADAYSKDYCEKYEFTDAEKNVPYIRYALFYAPETADKDAKEKALAAANAMKDSCKSIDDLTGLAETALANGTVMDQGDIAVPKGQMVAKFEEWAYGKDRKEGELDVIYAPEYGYFVVGYLGQQEQNASALNQIALKKLSDGLLEEIKSKKHDFHTDDKFAAAPVAPTATPAPDATETPAQNFDPNATQPSGTETVNQGPMTTTDVLVVVFFTLAGVAILAVIVILINYAIKNNKNASSGKPASRKYADDDEEDEDEEEEEIPVKSKKSSKKKIEEPEEDEESEDSEDSDEEDEEE